tara:strand:- start:10589 stop:11557 length:969 start_codon:yes stop_codon:yes gene_type:complete
MILLFKEETFAQEFRELLGFVDADINFKSVKSDLTSATREMIDFVGKPTYDRWVTLFEKENRSAAENDQLLLMRYPIAMNTYRLVAPSKDLQHTNQGRMLRTDDQQARPFEWMIERNNEANERKYYRAVDQLLDFLFDDTNFKQTIQYKTIRKYFVCTTADFEEYFPIHSRLLLMKLSPGLRQAEQRHIKPVLGTEKFDGLKALHLAGTAIPNEDQDLFDLIKEFAVYWSLHWAMPRLSVNLLPEGILQRYTSERESIRSTKVPEGLQTQHASTKFKEDAMEILSRIESEMTRLVTPPEDPHQDEEDDGFRLFDDDDNFAST